MSIVYCQLSITNQNYKSIATKKDARQHPERGKKAYTDAIEFDPSDAVYVKVKFKSGGMLRPGIDCEGTSIPSNLYMDEIET